MATSLQKYRVRPGTIDQGKDYEFKVATLMSLRCVLHEAEDSWIASNADEVGAFDDVILHLGGITYLLQLKHQLRPKPIIEREYLSPKGDFSVRKYLHSIQDLGHLLNSASPREGIVKNLDSINNIYFIIFTNRSTLDCNILQGNVRLNNFHLVNTSPTNSVKKIDITSIPDVASHDHYKFYLFYNQASWKDLDYYIKNEVEIIANSFNLTQVNVKAVAEQFTKFITNWAQGILGGHYCLQKQDIICKLTELFLSQYELDLRNKQFNFYYCPKRIIWNYIVRDKNTTLIDSSETVLEFLHQYIANEVKNYCLQTIQNWSENFSDKTQNLFYSQFIELKIQMLKFVTNHGRITAFDVYKCLWIQNKVPVVLIVSKPQDYHNIMGILQLSRYSYKTILLIRKSALPLPLNQIQNVACFESLEDLNVEQRNEILRQPGKLQGRHFDKLENIINKEMYKHIKCSDIISILLDEFNIGNELISIPGYYIERSVSNTYLKYQVLQKVSDDIFLIQKQSARDFDTFPIQILNVPSLEDVDFNHLIKCKIIAVPESEHLNLVEKLVTSQTVRGKNIHYLSIYDSKHLEWKSTFGSINNIKQFQVELNYIKKRDITQKLYDATTIISAPPGMGKSTLMNFIAYRAPIGKWVLRIDLNGHQQYYRSRNCRNLNTTSLEHLKYFNSAHLDKCNVHNKNVVEAVFEKFVATKDVIVLLDGFDEIAVSYKREVTNIAKRLQRDGYHIWITTRPFMKSYLEEQLNAFSVSLYPFSEDDQAEFLTKYFSTTNASLIAELKAPVDIIHGFVGKLLEASRKNLNDNDAEFTGIPLQTKLLGDVFNDEFIECLESGGVVDFNEKFDLLYLYENFIDKKVNILCKRYGDAAQDMSRLFKEHQSFFALKLLFPLDEFENLNIDKILDDYNKNTPEKLILLQREGLVTVDENFNVHFVHRTFAEFLVAEWLIDNCTSDDEQLKHIVQSIFQQRFTQNYKFLFNAFDQLVTKNVSLHLAINNGQIDIAKTIVTRDFNTVNEVDGTNRSGLHLIALKGVQFPVVVDEDNSTFGDLYFFQSKKFQTDNMLELLKIIPKQIIALNNNRDKMGFTPLEYAIRNRSLTIANEICSKLDFANINADVPLKYKSHYLSYCILLQYKSLFKILLSYFVNLDVLLKNVNVKKSVESYVEECFVERKGRASKVQLSKCVADFEGMSLLQLLQSKYGIAYSGYVDNFYTDLRFAVILGAQENVERLCKKAEINKGDLQFNNTPLHYSALHGNLESVKTLLRNGDHVNMENKEGDTPLHHAAANGYEDIIKELLLNNADVNKGNKYANTPLHLALMNGHEETANLLTDNGAPLNTVNKHGDYVIHLAVQKGYYEFMTKDADVNVSNFDGNTPLHLALMLGHLEIANLLISNGTLINKKNNKNQTALHCACEMGNRAIVTTLLHLENKPGYIGMEDNDGNSPLHVASISNHKEIVELLVASKANISAKNCKSETAFHCAAKSGCNDVLSFFLHKDVNINDKNYDGNTALHLAIIDCHLETVKVLVDNGADVTLKNKQNHTALFSAIKYATDSTINIDKWISVICFLIDRGSDLNPQDFVGNTPLHYLSSLENFDTIHEKIVLLLLDKGAQIDVQNKYERTALDLAEENNNNEFLIVLEQHVLSHVDISQQ